MKRNIYNTHDKRNVMYQQHHILYNFIIFPIWFVLSALVTYYAIKYGIIDNYKVHRYVVVFISMVVLLLTYINFFLVAHDIGYIIDYFIIGKKQSNTERALLSKPFPKKWHPKVALIYCTYNDFLPDCLYQCMSRQTYPVDVKIFDDSTKPKYIKEINKFSKLHCNVQVVRRVKHNNDKNKAGNLNHGLKVIYSEHYNYFVFLDSDELLEPDFVFDMLKEMYYGNKYGYHIGLIQANHHSGRNTNGFMHLNALSARFFWKVQNTVRTCNAGIRHIKGASHKGQTVMCNLGHGCIANANAIYESGFPNVVSEDIGNTFKLIQNGWNVYFSTQIYGNEETVISFPAFKTRCRKFAQGNVQWLQKFLKPIVYSNELSMCQKLDIIYMMATDSITSLMYISVPICSVIVPLLKSTIGFNPYFLIPTVIMLYISTFIDILFCTLYHLGIINIIKREILLVIIYSSVYFDRVKIVFYALFLNKKAKFTVTPKKFKRVTFAQSLKSNMAPILFSLITILYAFIFSKQLLLICLTFLPAIFISFAELIQNKHSLYDEKMHHIFHIHRQQALKYNIIPNDKYWNNWKI